jgi:alkanesulfonate monooxygenase SsuD/methylene tetrahydromethanopterin reductase-like flavin-dependent oxidoreductase (luciferase family)
VARVGELADGWLPAGVPNAAIPSMFEQVRAAATAAGRDASALELVVRANLAVLPEAVPEEGRFSFVGSFDQIVADLGALREMGVDEVHFDAQFSPGIATVADHLGLAERLIAAS